MWQVVTLCSISGFCYSLTPSQAIYVSLPQGFLLYAGGAVTLSAFIFMFVCKRVANVGDRKIKKGVWLCVGSFDVADSFIATFNFFFIVCCLTIAVLIYKILQDMYLMFTTILYY